MLRPILLLLILVVGCGPAAEIPAGAEAPDGTVRVPGGRFLMGTDSTDLPQIMERFGITRIEMLLPELPQHLIEVDEFFLDQTDVTNAQFFQFVQSNPQWSRTAADAARHNGRYLEHWSPEGPRETDLDRPVTYVTWYAAKGYCEWLGRRLPTEAEWEYAAGGGDPSRIFPWGTSPPSNDVVTWSGSGREEPDPVASHPPNALALYDMAGNVWKFLADVWRDSYHEPQLSGLPPPDTRAVDTRYVVRGGSYGASAVNMRIRYRDSHRANDAREMVGFRCASSNSTEEATVYAFEFRPVAESGPA